MNSEMAASVVEELGAVTESLAAETTLVESTSSTSPEDSEDRQSPRADVDGQYAIAQGDCLILASLTIIHRSKNPADLPLSAKAHLAADQDKRLTVLWMADDGKLTPIGHASLDSHLKPRFEIDEAEAAHRQVWQAALEAPALQPA